jgi:hypothetical protein
LDPKREHSAGYYAGDKVRAASSSLWCPVVLWTSLAGLHPLCF